MRNTVRAWQVLHKVESQFQRKKNFDSSCRENPAVMFALRIMFPCYMAKTTLPTCIANGDIFVCFLVCFLHSTQTKPIMNNSTKCKSIIRPCSLSASNDLQRHAPKCWHDPCCLLCVYLAACPMCINATCSEVFLYCLQCALFMTNVCFSSMFLECVYPPC